MPAKKTRRMSRYIDPRTIRCRRLGAASRSHAKVEAVEIPDKVESQLLDLVGRLGLRYGAVDMRLTPDGKYVLLEINPAGQFRYIEAATGQPMTATMAALLLSGDRA